MRVYFSLVCVCVCMCMCMCVCVCACVRVCVCVCVWSEDDLCAKQTCSHKWGFFRLILVFSQSTALLNYVNASNTTRSEHSPVCVN